MLKIARHHIWKSQKPFDCVTWTKRTAKITDESGKVLFEMEVEVPAQWSENATNIAAAKYLRKSGVPGLTPDPSGTGPETSIRQAIHRMANCWKGWGMRLGYFDAENAEIFYNEIVVVLLKQMASPNSPQWFNTGLDSYGIAGPAQGHWYVDAQGFAHKSLDAYSRPQPHACFIQSVEDCMFHEGGIFNLWEREALVFKFGSGTGTNFSKLRGKGEPLTNGGKAGGLMSWLKIGDAVGGAIKSGGSTRKAAKMVCLDADHPDIRDFIWWKAREELKVRALVEGHTHLSRSGGCPVSGDDNEYFQKSTQAGLHLDYDFDGDAYRTVGGQNSNNSVRVTNEFMRNSGEGGIYPCDWFLRDRASTRVTRVDARDLWQDICTAAWVCADPGLQFHTTINDWHTCPRDGEIRASNPCSEYMFLDDTGCNLASLNLMAFYKAGGGFDLDGYLHTIKLMTLVLDISVGMAQYPSREIALRSVRYRTLGLGYANLGALLMTLGLGYGTPEGRAVAAALTSIMTGQAYRMSCDIARELGAFPGYDKAAMGRVIRNHARCARALNDESEGLDVSPMIADYSKLPKMLCGLQDASTGVWREVLKVAEDTGFRNAQVTVLAPTGTIGIVMDCDTTGVEPDFALVKYKKMAGGGHMKMVNQSVAPALRALGYKEAMVDALVESMIRGDTWWAGMEPEHFEVFRVASGENALTPTQHIDMMAAVQPFISGAISKTVNMSNDATVEDISNAYRYAWKQGIKAIAIYRDGCKASQPLSTKKGGNTQAKPLPQGQTREPSGGAGREVLQSTAAAVVEPVGATVAAEAEQAKSYVSVTEARGYFMRATSKDGTIPAFRRPMPKTRNSITHKFKINNQSCYLTVGLFEDGTPGELFVRMSKAGSTVHGLLENFGRAISMAWQYGMPLDQSITAFSHQRFEPMGLTDDQDVPVASSVLDYAFRWLGKHALDWHSRATGTAPAPSGGGGGATTGAPEAPVAPRGIPVSRPGSGGPGGPPGGGDGPPCGQCGTIMIRNGSCHVCLNCGEQGGCG